MFNLSIRSLQGMELKSLDGKEVGMQVTGVVVGQEQFTSQKSGRTFHKLYLGLGDGPPLEVVVDPGTFRTGQQVSVEVRPQGALFGRVVPDKAA